MFQVKQIHLYNMTQTQLLNEARRRFSRLGYETSLLRDYPFLKTRAEDTHYYVVIFKWIMFDVMREQIDFPEVDKDLLVTRSETSTDEDYTVVQLYFEISWVLDVDVNYNFYTPQEDIALSTWLNRQVELEDVYVPKAYSDAIVVSVPSAGFANRKSFKIQLSDPEDGLLTRNDLNNIVDDHIAPYLNDEFIMDSEAVFERVGFVWAGHLEDDGILIRENEFLENPNIQKRYTFTMSDYLLYDNIQDENGNYPLDEDGNEVGIPQNEQEELDNDTIPQYTDQLTEGEEYTVVPLKTTWTLQQFQTLGKYYFEKELIYDNFLQDPEDVGCLSGIGYENVRLPVRTGQGGIYCVLVLEQWLGAGHTSDPLTNTKIETIHVMDEEEIREQEWRDIQNQRETLTAEINTLTNKRKAVTDNQAAMNLRQKIAKTEKKLRNLPSTLQEYGVAKRDRMLLRNKP